MLALLCCEQLASAQLTAPAGLPALAVARKLAPGQWARYSVVDSRNGQGIIVELAMLERERGGQWFELAITDRQKRTLVVRSLLAGVSRGKPRVLSSIVQAPGQRPLLLPASYAAKQRVPITPARAVRGGKRLGRQKIRVPAGTFTATHFRSRAGGRTHDSWLTSDAAGWPLVRYRSGTLLIELIARGKQSVSRISGTPVKLDKRLLRQLGGSAGGVQK